MRRKSTEQLTKDLENIIKRLYKNEDMESLRKIVEDTLLQLEKDSIAQGIEQKKSMKKTKADRVEEHLRDLKSQKEIISECQCSQSYVSLQGMRNKIYSRRKVKGLIKEGKSPEKIAQEGNVNLDAVIRLKEELERDKKSKKDSNENKARSSKAEKIIELAKDLLEDSKIAEKVQCSKVYSCNVRNGENIYSKRKVQKMLADGISAEEIAKEGNVNLDAVIRLKEELERDKKSKKDSNENKGGATQATKIIELVRTSVTIGDAKAIDAQNGHKQGGSNKPPTIPIYSNNSGYKINARDDKMTGESDRKNAKILQMAQQEVKSVERIVSALGIPEYTIRNILRKNNILPREVVISLIHAGEKTDEEIARESGCNLKAIEKLREKINILKQSVENNPKAKRAMEMLQRGENIAQISFKLKLQKKYLEDINELLVERNVKPISEERKQANFKLDMFNLRQVTKTSIIQASTIDLKIQKILYEYYDFLGRKEYAFFAYAYTKVSEYMKAMDIAEEHLGLETPSLSALKRKIEEVLQEEKEKEEGQQIGTNETESALMLERQNSTQDKVTKLGKTAGDSDGDEHSGR